MKTTQAERDARKKIAPLTLKAKFGCFAAVLAGACVCFIIYLAINDKSSVNAQAERTVSKYSITAINESKTRVEEWLGSDLISMNLDENQVLVSPVLWNSIDFEKKKELIVTLIIYQDQIAGSNDNPIALVNKRTGGELASWTSFSGFQFD